MKNCGSKVKWIFTELMIVLQQKEKVKVDTILGGEQHNSSSDLCSPTTLPPYDYCLLFPALHAQFAKNIQGWSFSFFSSLAKQIYCYEGLKKLFEGYTQTL